jgi:hypothetical protein
VVKSVDVYGDMHRYIPVLAANAGFRRITKKKYSIRQDLTELQNSEQKDLSEDFWIW